MENVFWIAVAKIVQNRLNNTNEKVFFFSWNCRLSTKSQYIRTTPPVLSRSFETTFTTIRSSHQRCSMKKGVLRNFAKFTGKHLCQSLFFNNFLEISKNTFFTEHLWTTGSEPCVYKTCLLDHLFEFAPKLPLPSFLIQIYLTFTEILPLPKKLKKLTSISLLE